MGARLSAGNVTSGVKEQAAGATRELYKFLDLNGGGELVTLMKDAKKSKIKDYSLVDERIKVGLKQFLYDEGRGQWTHVKHQIQCRLKDKGVSAPKKMMLPTEKELSELEELKHMKEYKAFLEPGKIGYNHPKPCRNR